MSFFVLFVHLWSNGPGPPLAGSPERGSPLPFPPPRAAGWCERSPAQTALGRASPSDGSRRSGLFMPGDRRSLAAIHNGSVPRAPTAAVRRLPAEQRLLLGCADDEPALRLAQAHQ